MGRVDARTSRACVDIGGFAGVRSWVLLAFVLRLSVEGRAVHVHLRPAVEFFSCSGSACWGGFGWLTGAQPCAGSGLAGSCLGLGRLALAWRGAEVWLASEGRLSGQFVFRADAWPTGSAAGSQRRSPAPIWACGDGPTTLDLCATLQCLLWRCGAGPQSACPAGTPETKTVTRARRARDRAVVCTPV
jgi:hypothetical protein